MSPLVATVNLTRPSGDVATPPGGIERHVNKLQNVVCKEGVNVYLCVPFFVT